ncbi:hypothetical protein CsSME_00006074 [Camellia sinensis var. sinensis]
MNQKLVPFLCIFLLFAVFSGDVSCSQVSNVPFTSLSRNDNLNALAAPPARRSLLSLSDEHDTALVAALDGTIHLVEPKSRKVFWSFTSGPSIYSSYQAPVEGDNDKENASQLGSFFIDCGDDWELYMHDAFGKRVCLKMSSLSFLFINAF